MHIFIMSAACAFAIASLYYNQPLLPLIGDTFGAAPSMTSLVVMFGQIGYALGLLLFVPIGDRVERRRLILALLSANSLSLLACAFAPNFTLFAIATVLAGLTNVTPQIIIPTIVGQAPKLTRGRTVGFLLAGMSTGILVGRTLSGFVGGALGWQSVFMMAGGVNVILAITIWRRLPVTEPTTREPYAALMGSLWTLLKAQPALRTACAASFVAFAGLTAVWASLAPLLAQPPYGFGAQVAGLFGLIGVLSIVTAPAVGGLIDRFGSKLMTRAGLTTIIVAYGCVAFGGITLWPILVGLILIDFGCRFVMISNQTIIYPLQADAHSRLNTLLMCSAFFGGAVGSAIGAVGAGLAGWAGLGLVSAALAAMGLIVHELRTRSPRPAA